METIDTFRFDHQRHTAASSLRPEHGADFMRLVKDIRYGSPFQFLIAEYNDILYRDFLIGQLDAVLTSVGLRPIRLDLSRKSYADFAALETKMRSLAADYQAIHIVDTENWFDAEQWEAFNIRREAVAQSVPLRLIFWLDAKPISQLALIAPDLWAWRGGVFSFATTADFSVPEPRLVYNPIDIRSLPQRSKRIAELRSYLKSEPPPPDDIRLFLLDELAELLLSLGELDESLRIRQEEELLAYRKLGDERSVAITQGKIADILHIRGQFDEALRIRQEGLPVYRKLGDMRSVAATLGKVADILHNQGQLNEALHILQDEVLPIFKQLGDLRSVAVTQGKAASILSTRGQFDEALHIRQKEQLPVYLGLGDTRAVAIVQGKIADILSIRGQFDEALHLLQNEALPIFQKLGDVRFVAISQGKVADILYDRGQHDEALRILQNDVLPVFQKLGDERSVAVVQDQIANILNDSGKLNAEKA